MLPWSVDVQALVKSHLKIVFWLNLGVGFAFQAVKILQYSCELKRKPALTLNQNPNFEITSNYQSFTRLTNSIMVAGVSENKFKRR